MASGSSGRANSGSKGFDFGSDDILCSYEDFGNQDPNNGNHSDSAIGSNANKDFQKTRMARPTVFPTTTYAQPDDSFTQDLAATVEKVMKKHTDNVFRFLEGLSSRLSQLELYCYNLDKSIGEMRNDLVRDHEEGDAKLKTIEKHLQEVHRSVQILRDKQELAETQKELAKLQLAQKESSSSPPDGRTSPAPPSESKRTDNTPDIQNQQLALPPPPPPHQQQNVGPAPVQNVNNQQPYYLPPVAQHPQNQYLPADAQYRTPQVQDISRGAAQPGPAQTQQAPLAQHSQNQYLPPDTQYRPPQGLDIARGGPQPGPAQTQQAPPAQHSQNQYLHPDAQYRPPQGLDIARGGPQPGPAQTQQPPPAQHSQSQYLPPDAQYRTPQVQDMARGGPQPGPAQVNQAPRAQPFQQYQQQWPPQQAQPPQQPAMQTQMRPVYATNEPLPSGMSMQVPYSGQPMPNRPDSTMPYGYGGPGRTVPQQPPPQQMQGNFGLQPGDGYAAPRQTFPPGGTYMMYDTESGRAPPGPPQSQQPQFPQGGGYPPSTNLMARQPQFTRNHPYSDLIEKMVNMGFRGDHVVGVIQRMEETGQPVDFNSVLDRLNVHSSGNSQRGGWSG